MKHVIKSLIFNRLKHEISLWERLVNRSLSRWKNPKHPRFMSLTTSAFPSPSQLRITEWLRVAGISGGHQVQPSAQGGPSQLGCSEPCPDSSWESLRMEILPPFWATCASTQVTLIVRKLFLCFSLSLLPQMKAATPCCGSLYPLILYNASCCSTSQPKMLHTLCLGLG